MRDAGDGDKPDYPAAHSMDSEWFAVDADGHVAQFSTGEAGARPRDSAFLWTDVAEDPALARRLAAVSMGSEVIVDPDQCVPLHAGSRVARKSDASDFEVLMFLRDFTQVREDLEAGRCVAVKASRGVAAFWPRLTGATRARLHACSACCGCRRTYYRFREMDWNGMPSNPAAHGIFFFEHRCEESHAAPYVLSQRPSRPLVVDVLPPDLAKQLSLARFATLCFADPPLIQPFEHLASVAWGASWMESRKRHLHCIKGKEANYASEIAYIEQSSRDDGLTWDSPEAPAYDPHADDAPLPTTEPE